MELSKSSWHYWLFSKSYTLFGFNPRTSTDLCQYMRRLFFFLAIPGAFLWLQIASLYFHWYPTFLVEGLTLVMLTGIVLMGFFIEWYINGDSSFGDTLFGQWLSAKKQKVCPLITFNDQ